MILGKAHQIGAFLSRSRYMRTKVSHRTAMLKGFGKNGKWVSSGWVLIGREGMKSEACSSS